MDKLNDKEKAWLNKFANEYIGADFRGKGKALHNTRELKRDCYSKNNAANRDILTKVKAAGSLVYLEDMNKSVFNNTNEDDIIENIDKENELMQEELNNTNQPSAHSDDSGEDSE